ncbi:L-idonate 5-dehydrogenase [Roseinatronobacter sp. HJB301]|uniref:L-idonate 5-dehydrogenase n=2 Tax=Roseinatronobacter alkalisoli TaxID=3028235 RepID=A0ABT5TDZ9_9RHOB|nr:L-idonate 5-dehydrogenase [Roseinatronobacter sp. HJB301]MDD7973349.1 L-idonate 5-dehydrogenase [Roseinatronobacter sp. HJB301]
MTKACRLHGRNDLRIEDVALADPGPGEALVRLGAGGICGSDLHYYHDGGFGPIRVREPIILGHEASGTIEAIGAGVNLTVGQKVALNPSRPCHDCTYCRDGLFQHCLNMRFNGSALRMPHEQGFFRERMVVNAAQCVPVPDTTSLSEAACAEPLAVCLHALGQAPDLAGRRVMVTGAGPIGVLCVALARRAGAAEIVVTDLQDLPLKVARTMGATDGINVADAPEQTARFEADKGYFDVTFECSAAAPALRAAIACTRPRGTVIQLGVAGDLTIPINLLVGKEIRLHGTHRFHQEFLQAVELISTGTIDVTPMISATLPMERAQDAIGLAGDRSRAVKVHITF